MENPARIVRRQLPTLSKRSTTRRAKLICCRARWMCCSANCKSKKPTSTPALRGRYKTLVDSTSKRRSTKSRSQPSRSSSMMPRLSWADCKNRDEKRVYQILRRSRHSVLSQTQNLLRMVLSVDKMEFAPLVDRQRAKHGVIGDRFGATKACLACADDFLHLGQALQDFCDRLLRWRAAREHPLGRLPAWREKSQPRNKKALPAFAAAIRTGDGVAGSQTTLQVFGGADVR